MSSDMPHYLIRTEPLPPGSSLVLCQFTWREECPETATWKVACGPDESYFCDAHHGPHPCRGVFIGEFVVTPETARADVLRVRRCGAHLMSSASGREIDDLFCCACGEWVGDMEDPEISHVSLPLDTECDPERDLDRPESRCRACAELMEHLDSEGAQRSPGRVVQSPSDP